MSTMTLAKKTAKRLARRGLAKAGAGRLFRPVFGGLGSILMFHNVVEKSAATQRDRLAANVGLDVSPGYLDAIVKHLKNRGFEFLSLDEVCETLRDPRSKTRRFVSFTFDDGYAGNLLNAAPILKAHGVPFAVYVTTGFIDRSAIPWWYAFEALVLENDELRLRWPDGEQHLVTRSRAQKDAAFAQIRAKVMLADPHALMPWLERTLAEYRVEPHRFAESLAMTWDQVIELSREPLCTIAGHTETHPVLKTLDASQIFEEVQNSRHALADRVRRPVDHFAYPFGDDSAIDARSVEIIAGYGFKSCTTTYSGNIQPEHGERLARLPRIAVPGDEEDLDLLDLTMSGANSALFGGFRRVV